MLGIADPHYQIVTVIIAEAIDLARCKNTTNDATGANCKLQKIWVGM